MKSFNNAMGSVTQRYGRRQVFSGFLNMVVCSLSAGAKEDQYLEAISRYETREINRFPEVMACLVSEMDNQGTGLLDILGTYFEQEISMGHNGQFFTPEPICDMMAMMMKPISFGQSIADPACGSGRNLMAAAKINRHCMFFGADNDADCARMTAINLCLNGMFGEVAWMNSLSNEYYSGWKIGIHPEHNVPYLLEIPQEKSLIHLKLPTAEKPAINQPQLIIDF
jgi:type I restriction-modification system DNA methylase subunit